MYYKYAHDNSLWIHKHINKDVFLINRILNRILQDDVAYKANDSSSRLKRASQPEIDITSINLLQISFKILTFSAP